MGAHRQRPACDGFWNAIRGRSIPGPSPLRQGSSSSLEREESGAPPSGLVSCPAEFSPFGFFGRSVYESLSEAPFGQRFGMRCAAARAKATFDGENRQGADAPVAPWRIAGSVLPHAEFRPRSPSMGGPPRFGGWLWRTLGPAPLKGLSRNSRRAQFVADLDFFMGSKVAGVLWRSMRALRLAQRANGLL